MNKKGFTLIELIVVIAIIAILAAIAVPNFTELIDTANKGVDTANAELVGRSMQYAFIDGTLIVKNNRVFNTVSNRSYSGTGSWFYEDMNDYLSSRISPLGNESQNTRNFDPGDGSFKYLFKISGDNVIIYYKSSTGSHIEINTVQYRS